MSRPCCCYRELSCALTVLATWLSATVHAARAEDRPTYFSESLHAALDAAESNYSFASSSIAADETTIFSPTDLPPPETDECTDELADEPLFDDPYPPGEYCWQLTPPGLIYRSYLAGAHEPRTGITSFHEGADRTIWDATLGGRGGVLRYGTSDPLRPLGWQLDVYGAAIARLDVENRQDLDSTDYVFGFPLTYGVGAFQFKFGYAHISSHLGDELALREPGTLNERVNYVRDAIVLGTSFYPHPVWRMYGEAAWAFHGGGGAQPWEGQFGTELSRPGATGAIGSPFFAVNGRMREEHDFGGDVTAQTGWLWRGITGQVIRLGVHYFNGKSNQYQFFDESEEQLGMGIWYDF